MAMTSLLIKDIPDRLHERLREEARKNRRSMVQETIKILEESLDLSPVNYPEPVKGSKKVTRSTLSKAIREGRE
jgi:plasmid stability protein